MNNFKNIEAWKYSYDLSLQIYECSKSFREIWTDITTS